MEYVSQKIKKSIKDVETLAEIAMNHKLPTHLIPKQFPKDGLMFRERSLAYQISSNPLRIQYEKN